MFERGPNGYWFEDTITDEIWFITMGFLMLVYGMRCFMRPEKWDGMAPIVGIMVFMPGGIMFIGSILYLMGIPM